MNIRILGLVAITLLFCNSAFASVPVVLGTWTGTKTMTATNCVSNPSLDGDTSTKIETIIVTNQTEGSPDVFDNISGTSFYTDSAFWPAASETFSGSIYSDGFFTVTFSPSGDTATGFYVNGVINVDATSYPSADKEPYLSGGCEIDEAAFTLTGGAQVVNAANAAGTAIVTGSTQTLQSFVNNTVFPVMTRIQNIVVNLITDTDTQGTRFDMNPVAGGYKISGQTGRAAGGDIRNLAGWGSVTYTDLENDNALTAYDGERMAFQFGLDYMPKDNMVAGVSLGYEDLDVTTTFNQGSVDGEGFTIAPYVGAVIDDHWSFDALIGFSALDYDQVRSSGTIKGSTDATRFFWAANLNHTYAKKDQWLIMTRAGMMFAKETTDGFIEDNGTVNPEREASLVQAQFGADFTYLAGDNFEPYLNATYNYDLSSSSINVVGVTGGLVNPFDDDDDLLIGAGFNYYASENSTASFELRHRLAREDFEETIFSASYRANF
ncbi:MAG: autotransporter outer membrane beta-barrel domain-containing protein [Gammaproteobacteria bacterium]|nr:autotransporter outer membrane beta-barrel domain-containing protein [Gammaproteobacteria bacterium]